MSGLISTQEQNSLEASEIDWQLHVGLRLERNGVITLPRYHSTACSLKWTLDYDLNIVGEPFIYIDILHVARPYRNSGLATRLLHVLRTANDKSPKPRWIGLVACPGVDESRNIVELDEWYERRGFKWNETHQFQMRKAGDNSIHKVISKFKVF